jgi:hypothetical protein
VSSNLDERTADRGGVKMSSVQKLLDISSRLSHLEQAAEWVAKETVHTDNAISQTGTLICVLAEEVRERVCALVLELENDLKEVLDCDKLN